MPRRRSTQPLLELFESKQVVDLTDIQSALGDVSEMTCFRYLKQVPYRRSYNKNGRYYTRHEPSRYDRWGLWSSGDIHFSVDGSLRQTVLRLVHEAEAGATDRELQERLRVRVHATLVDLVRKQQIDRERVAAVYIYLHIDAAVREAQLACRQQRLADASADRQMEVDDAVVIQVLLCLIRHPESRPADVVRHLRGHAPPIPIGQVRAVFTRYELGEKRGSTSS